MDITLRPPGGDVKEFYHREQYYGTMRKTCQQSPRNLVVALERTPEYSEEIYPYATFHLPEHENQSAAMVAATASASGASISLNRKGHHQSLQYDTRSGDDNTLSSAGVKVKRSMVAASTTTTGTTVSMGTTAECASHASTEKRHKRRSKAIKSESEEYDSLNSDSDLSVRESVMPAEGVGRAGHSKDHNSREEVGGIRGPCIDNSPGCLVDNSDYNGQYFIKIFNIF